MKNASSQLTVLKEELYFRGKRSSKGNVGRESRPHLIFFSKPCGCYKYVAQHKHFNTPFLHGPALAYASNYQDCSQGPQAATAIQRTAALAMVFAEKVGLESDTGFK